MAMLEKLGFLEKEHTSSGRIPSIDGYKYFAEKLADRQNNSLEKKLQDIFAKRRVSIDFTLEEAANAITEIAGFTLSISSKDTDELMKSIQLTPINDNMATIVIVTSAGRVESKLIEFNNHVKIDDVRIAVRLFKERLIDSRLRDLSLKVEALAPILSETVKNHEAVIQAFVGKVFDFHNKVQNKVYGNSNIIKAKEIKREDVAKLIELVETKSV
uniref:Heat-inducible transcription repressor HrcA C-terminal domain-containing protein n=1 Tax=Biomphalaria glabrata TaxID=6526 RepID=A0A2C9L899_BIOGL